MNSNIETGVKVVGVLGLAYVGVKLFKRFNKHRPQDHAPDVQQPDNNNTVVDHAPEAPVLNVQRLRRSSGLHPQPNIGSMYDRAILAGLNDYKKCYEA